MTICHRCGAEEIPTDCPYCEGHYCNECFMGHVFDCLYFRYRVTAQSESIEFLSELHQGGLFK